MNLKNDEGSFTIEASMLLPIIMGITMLLLFFCLYTYQRTMLLQVASVTAERAAFNWDNSHKGAEGAFAIGYYDSLYWRIGEDGLLTSLFGAEAGDGGVQLTLPAAGGSGTLPVVKLQQSAAKVPANITGELAYTYSLTSRKVSAELKRVLHLPVLDEILEDNAEPEVQVQSVVADPVEFIRTVDLMRYYGAKFKGKGQDSGSGTSMEKQDAGKMLTKLKK
ncbi:TadE/TadG family type IV pilus assembly protein [Paenibacillus pedocola]|uniref:TadE/TadG family type IV pilus assembly protein n=1 Tax=Paenibacillus pedocola TaxID=3242193 RepID=UPI002877FF22|nr:pilus assembly protein [Paenibacillus typhae]